MEAIAGAAFRTHNRPDVEGVGNACVSMLKQFRGASFLVMCPEVLTAYGERCNLTEMGGIVTGVTAHSIARS